MCCLYRRAGKRDSDEVGGGTARDRGALVPEDARVTALDAVDHRRATSERELAVPPGAEVSHGGVHEIRHLINTGPSVTVKCVQPRTVRLILGTD